MVLYTDGNSSIMGSRGQYSSCRSHSEEVTSGLRLKWRSGTDDKQVV